MTTPTDGQVTISCTDVRIAALVASIRVREPGAEQRRLILVDELLRVERNLARVLGEHARHALSESRGSHSTWDVAAEAEEVFTALEGYAATLQLVVGEHRSLIASRSTDGIEPATTTPDSRATAGPRDT